MNDIAALTAEVELQKRRADDYAEALKRSQSDLRCIVAEVERLAALNAGLHAALLASHDAERTATADVTAGAAS